MAVRDSGRTHAVGPRDDNPVLGAPVSEPARTWPMIAPGRRLVLPFTSHVRLRLFLLWLATGVALTFAPLEIKAAASSTAVTSPSIQVSVRWVPDSNDTNRTIVEVAGLSAATLRQLRQNDRTLERWQRLLPVRAEQGDLFADFGLPPMLGTYRVTGDTLRFEPQFPLEAGLPYRATFHPDELTPGKTSGARPISTVFRRPARRAEPSTLVTHVYPSAGTVPENLLKFYVHFSAPMSGGHIYEHIHLLNDGGKPVELPFLEIDEELWNPEMTRLTLFIDPGRIKRGVKPLEEIGPSMEAGKSYTLVIDRDWKDSAGISLKAGFRKAFQVGPPDREPPDPARWKVLPPKPGTHDPLSVNFLEPLDHALAQRLIQVKRVDGSRVPGTTTLDEQEQRWNFVPAEAWRAGAHQLTIQTTIEDLAGNNIGKPFEVDVFEGVQRRLTRSTATVRFEVR
jgi:hypothetical protein